MNTGKRNMGIKMKETKVMTINHSEVKNVKTKEGRKIEQVCKDGYLGQCSQRTGGVIQRNEKGSL